MPPQTMATASAVDPARAPALSRVDSTQIDLLRTLCIFLMLSVHVYPPLGTDTILRGGPLHGIWFVYVDILGRASVAVLSLIAGYILWVGGRARPVSEVVSSRAVTLLLPLVTWNLIFLGLVAGLAVLRGQPPGAELAQHGAATPLGLLSAVAAVADHPANLPLAFLRDLFVSVVALRLVLPWLPRIGPALVAALLAVALFDMGEPLILRPSIPLFVACGALIAARGVTLERASDLRVTWPFALAFAAALAVGLGLPDLPVAVDEEVLNLAKRGLLVVGLLALGRAVVRRTGPVDLRRLRPLVFLAFLSHGIVNQAMGEVWEMAGMGTESMAYVWFFFANAPIDLAVAWVGTLLIDRLPRVPQLALRGSVREAAPGRAGPRRRLRQA